MISMMIFALIATVAAVALVSNLQSASSNRARVAGADLALRELETVRSAFMSTAKGPATVLEGLVINPQPDGTEGGPTATTRVDGRDYTVTRVAEWEPQGATSGPCDGGAVAAPGAAAVAFLKVSVYVTWVGMGTTAPPTNSTLLTPPLGTYKDGTGHIKVKVTDSTGQPEADTDVTIYTAGPPAVQVGATQSTAADGCAFFAFLNPGNYIVKLSRPNYVGTAWQSVPQQSTSVAANTVTSVQLGYALQSTLQLDFDASVPGFPPADATPVTVNSANLPTTSPWPGWANTLSVSASTDNVYPWPDAAGVVAWAGDCRDSDPAPPNGTGVRQNAWPTSPGVTTITAIGGARVTVNVKKLAIPKAGITVYAVHPRLDSSSNPWCPSSMSNPVGGPSVGEVLQFKNTTDSFGNASILLPYGTWTFETSSASVAAWPTLTYSAAGAPTVVSIVLS